MALFLATEYNLEDKYVILNREQSSASKGKTYFCEIRYDHQKNKPLLFSVGVKPKRLGTIDDIIHGFAAINFRIEVPFLSQQKFERSLRELTSVFGGTIKKIN